MKNNREAYEALMRVYPFTTDDLDGEVWREVSKHYHVSNFGRVKSFWNGKVKILKPLLNSSGYIVVTLSKDGRHKQIHVHRLVAQAFISNPENKPQVNHLDGNKLNAHVTNLEWVTARENQRHAFSTGLHSASQGEDHVHSKLTNKQAILIRENKDNLSVKALAELFGISETAVRLVQLGDTYKSAGGEIRPPRKVPIPKNVREKIKSLHMEEPKLSTNKLSKMFGCASSTIWKILHEGD